MRYVLDTNILLHYLRKSPLSQKIDETYAPLDFQRNEAIMSVVSVGELMALSKINRWGSRKVADIELLLDELLITDIRSEDVIERYAEIDAYSQGKLEHKPLGMSARNMGKNDIWIAATASVLGGTLLTTDQDFNHLHGVFLEIRVPVLA